MVKLMSLFLQASFTLVLVIVLHTAEARNVRVFCKTHVMNPKAYESLKQNGQKIPQAIDYRGHQIQNILAKFGEKVNLNKKLVHTYVVGNCNDVTKSLREGPHVSGIINGKARDNVKESNDMFFQVKVKRSSSGEVTQVIEEGLRKIAAAMKRNLPVHLQTYYTGGVEYSTSRPKVIYSNIQGPEAEARPEKQDQVYQFNPNSSRVYSTSFKSNLDDFRKKYKKYKKTNFDGTNSSNLN